MKILIIGAHPDDEIFGCGGTIAKLSEKNNEIYVFIMTRAYTPDWTVAYIKWAKKAQESIDKFFGIKKRYNADYPTVMLNNIPHGDMAKEIKKVVDEVQPDIVFTHHSDLNLDHLIVFRATCVACRPPSLTKIYSYEIPSSTELSPDVFKPNFYVSLSKNHIIKKMKALEIYHRELKKSRSLRMVETLARKRGDDIVRNYAEAFELIREVKM